MAHARLARHRRRTAAVLGAALLGGAVAVLPIRPAVADVPGDAEKWRQVEPARTSWTAVMQAQVELDRAADRIDEAVAALGTETGLAGLRVSPRTRELFVYWHGTVPAPLQRRIGEVARSVPVTVVPAPYSYARLQAARKRLRTDQRFAATGVTVVRIPVDGTGLEIGFGASLRAKAGPFALPDLGVPTRSISRGMPVPLIGRADDTPPFWGGAIIQNRQGAFCSSGFSLRKADGHPFTMTDYHCQDPVTAATRFWTYTGTELGVTYEWDALQDTTIIDTQPNGGSGAGIYTKGTPSGYSAARVTGWGVNRVGDFVCTSGAFSGELCDIEITDVHAEVPTSAGTFVEMAEGEQIQLKSAAGQGDSGGPVFSWDTDDTVTARGLVAAGDPDTRTLCTGIDPSNRICSWRIYFSQMQYAVNHYRATVIT
jgi:hypothetical protein